MLKAHQDILKRLRENIVNEIDVHNHILQALKTPCILNEEHIKLIETGLSKKEKAEILLDILPHQGPHAFSHFHQALRLQYDWLSDSIDRLLESPGNNCKGSERVHTNIPSISPLTVSREDKEKELKKALESLIPKGYVVLHGMKGYGKSCLTINVLNDFRLATTLFDNQIYWIEFGKHRPVEEDIWIQMNNLYHQITNSHFTSNASSSNHIKETLRLSIQNHFRQNAHKNALLILDDANKKEIIDAFDFDCKILVITTDISVLSNRHSINIEMKDGFTKMETLKLFAYVLNMEVDRLPKEAALIHEECKGMPLLITMLASQFHIFKQSMQHDNTRWKYYLNSLKTKNRKINVIGEFLEKQEAIFQMAIDELSEDKYRLYSMMAIFNEDVNIMPMTLEILWDKDNSYEVEEIMLEFFNKSLVVKHWNLELKSYIYGVHDHMLEFLRKKMTSAELQIMHQSFIDKCRKYGDGSLIKLPDDNYTYTYIGHHLEQAKVLEEFPQLYLDFDFLQAKIYHTGISDLLIDLTKYRSYITRAGDLELETKVKDLELFLQRHASMLAKERTRHYLDLVQIAMNNPEEGFVRNTARRLALQRANYLYVSIESKINHADAPFSEEVPMCAMVARFTDNPDEILLGGESGGLLLWNCATRNSKYFYGHSRSCDIQKIVISKDGTHFLSLSNDGVVKLFEIYEQDYLSPSSPRQRQSKWYCLFNEEDYSKISINVEDDTITDVSFGRKADTIVTCTVNGLLEIWNKDGSKVFKEISNLGPSVKKIALTNDNHLLHCLNMKDGILEVYGLRNDKYTHVSKFNVRQKDMKVIYMVEYDRSDTGSTMIIVTEEKVCFVRWYYNHGQIHSYDVKSHEIDHDYQPSDKETKVVYTCAALTYDEKYLILADSIGNVSVRETCCLFNLVISYRAHVSSLDTYWLPHEKAHLICGSEKRIIHVWKLDGNKDSTIVKKPAVFAIIKEGEQEDIIVTETIIGSIVVWSNSRMLYEIPKVEGKIAKLFLLESDKIVFFTEEKKMVSIIDCKTQVCRTIFPINTSDSFFTVIKINRQQMIICQENRVDIKIWYEENNKEVRQHFLKNVGSIFEIFPLLGNYLLTLTQDGKLKFWHVRGTNWKEIGGYDCNIERSKVTYSSLSSDQNCLAIVIDYQKVILCFINFDGSEDGDSDPNYTYSVCDKTVVYTRDNYENERLEKVKCCAFSWDAQCLAIGMDSGEIMIIDLINDSDIRKLNYHQNSVEQLHWASSSVGLPVFLSVSNNEMAWWNLSLSKLKRTVHRQSRMGISSSNSSPNVSLSPRSSLILSNSKSFDFARLSLSLPDSKEPNINGSTSNVKKTWSLKVGKDPEYPELLGTVPFPTICNTKVYVSNDFVKFLAIDAHGAITKYKLYEK